MLCHNLKVQGIPEGIRAQKLPNQVVKISDSLCCWWLVRATYVVDGLFFGHFFWKVEGSCAHTRESHVAHVHGNALTCSIPSMVEGCTAHVWLTCMVMPSRVAFPQMVEGIPSRVAHVHGNALTCSIPSMVEASPSRTAHVWLTCTVMPSCVAFSQWWRGAPHIQLTCGSRAR